MTRWHVKAVVTVVATIAAAIGIAGCSNLPRTLALPSGTLITVLSEDSQSFQDTDGAQRRSFTVMYETSQNINDAAALRNEAVEVFSYYKGRIDTGDYARVNISATRKDDGGGLEAHTFYLERQLTGEWVIQ